MPQLGDPNFHRTVVLMIEHSDEGAMGLVINRQAPLKLGDLAKGQQLKVARHREEDFVYLGGPVEQSEEDWDRVVDVNLKSVFLTCKHVLPVMEKQGKGAIVNISSIASIRWLGVPYISYHASKAAINQLTQAVAMQYAKKGIRCNAVLPGLMNTPMVHAALPGYYSDGDADKMVAIRDAQCPTGKMGDAWDVAYASLFFASDEAKYVTGQCLAVDGGITAKID